jgi:PAS domain S-box-containing protein
MCEAMSTIPSDDKPGSAAVDLVDLIGESVVVFGFDMRVTAWNAEAERLYGWKREEVLGGVIQAAVQCSLDQPLSVILVTVQETGVWRGEFVRTTKSRKTVAVSAKWTLRRDIDGQPFDIVETSRDLTEVRRTEEDLSRVQYQYQNLFQASVASFWELGFGEVGSMVRDLLKSGITDLRVHFRDNPDYVRRMIRATRIIDVNEQSVQMFGNGDREAARRSLDPYWPDESLPVFAESVVAAFEGKPHFSSEAVFTSLDGQRFETLFTVSYPPKIMQTSRILVGIVDVTQANKAKAAQEASERRYQELFRFLPISLLQLEGREVVEVYKEARSRGITEFLQHLKENPDIVDRLLNSLMIVEVNQRTVSMFRARSMDEFTGSVARYWTESREVFCEAVAARYAGKPGFESLVRMRAHDGTIIDALFFAAFEPITGKQESSIVGLIDVSDRVKAQEMLAHVQAEIAHAARVSVLGELAASIAHEVSQPLTAIETNTEASMLWLQRSPPNIEEVRELSARTAVEVQRAADIIHRIRSMAVRAEPEHRSIDLNLIVQEAMLFLRHELQRNEVHSSLQLGSQLPNVFGDRVQLQQVIVNLAINAIQAMASAKSMPRVLTVRTARTSRRDVAIYIEDTGPGIADEAFERLFESFFTTKATGMGIGLPICRSIVEAHGGEISAGNREEGTGALFTIHLPEVSTDEPTS